MKVAVIGSGGAGLSAAYALSASHDVSLFERAGRFGGHAHTVLADLDGTDVPVDTGFIVFNESNYPNLISLFAHLGVATQETDMSFGFSLDGGRFEYACDALGKIFAQKRNMFDPRFLAAFRDVLRFVREAPAEHEAGIPEDLTLGEWLLARNYGRWFRERFLLPMGGAIWSMPMSRVLAFPAASFIGFFYNHALFAGLADSVRWRTVTGGSRSYVNEVVRRLGDRAHASAGVAATRRVKYKGAGKKVEVSFADGSEALFDHVVFAAHAPQSFALATDLNEHERSILGVFRTTANRAILHRDPRLMPLRRKVWSSWSMVTERTARGDDDRAITMTYWLNRLQDLPTDRNFFVTLNGRREPYAAMVMAEFEYHHPCFDGAAFAAQARMDEIQGIGGYWYAGAWLGWGFHEDAVRSGLRVAAALGASPDWAVNSGPPLGRSLSLMAG